MTELANTNGHHSRRGILKRGAVLAAGAFGVAVAGRNAQAATTPGADELRLFGVHWRLAAPGRRPGDRIRLGDQGAVYGDLLDAPKGKTLGRFFGSRMALQSSPGGNVRADASIEVHTFVLPGGTIVGMGTAFPGEAVFAVVGGTGSYAGAKGSYTAIQRLREHGGDGTADFVLTLHRLEA